MAGGIKYKKDYDQILENIRSKHTMRPVWCVMLHG